MALVAVAWVTLSASAQAQLRGYFSSDPNVTVDLSVLGGPGNETVTTVPLPGPGAQGTTVPGAAAQGAERAPSGLLFPPKAPPPSQLSNRYSTMAPLPLRRPPTAGSTGALADPKAPPQSRLTMTPPEGVQTAPTTRMAPKPPVAPSTTRTKTKPVPTPVPSAPRAPATAPVQSTSTQPLAPTPPAAPSPTVASRPASPQPSATPPPPAPAPAATPAPAPAQTQQPKPVETATRSAAPAPTDSAAPDSGVRVLFEGGSAKLPDSARNSLLGLVAKLEADQDLRLQIEAYAAGNSETASQARRLSLSRALSVRSYLIEQGVRSTRMDVRALGNKPSDSAAPADRVDTRLVKR